MTTSRRGAEDAKDAKAAEKKKKKNKKFFLRAFAPWREVFLNKPSVWRLCAGLAVLLLFFPGCSRKQADAAEPVDSVEVKLIEAGFSGEAVEALPEPVKTEPRFAVIPPNARPGEPVTVGIAGNSAANLEAVLLDSRGRRVTKAAFFSLDREEGEPQLQAAVLAIPSTALAGDALIRVESHGEIVRELPFFIDSREFLSETVHLDQGNTDLRTLPDPQKTAESQELWAILSRTGTKIHSGSSFEPPVTSTRRTSAYGNRRVYQYADGSTDTTIHAGIDYGVPRGTEVRACAPGMVVLAKSRIVTGNTVILEHLPGLYSLYYHLDSIAVSEGSAAGTGTVLGESGSTGLATGPHLHWEIRAAGENADPDAFMSRPVLDKNDILNKLN